MVNAGDCAGAFDYFGQGVWLQTRGELDARKIPDDSGSAVYRLDAKHGRLADANQKCTVNPRDME